MKNFFMASVSMMAKLLRDKVAKTDRQRRIIDGHMIGIPTPIFRKAIDKRKSHSKQ